MESSSYVENTVKLIRHYQFNNIVGEIMYLIEMCGLSEKQESALKQGVKRAIWSEWGSEYSFTVYNSIKDQVYKLVNEAKDTIAISNESTSPVELSSVS